MTASLIPQRYDPACPIDSLSEHPSNPRRGDVEAIGASIEHNGFYGAVLVQSSTGYIIAGNHRWKAARDQGLATLPAFFADLDDGQALRILLADNRTNDLATYDEQALRDLLEQLAADEAGGVAALAGSGYEATDLSDLVAKLTPPTLEELEQEFGDEPEEDAFWPVVRLKVAPETKDRLDILMAQAPGVDEAEKFAAVLSCVDVTALGSVGSGGGERSGTRVGGNGDDGDRDDLVAGADDWEPED